MESRRETWFKSSNTKAGVKEKLLSIYFLKCYCPNATEEGLMDAAEIPGNGFVAR